MHSFSTVATLLAAAAWVAISSARSIERQPTNRAYPYALRVLSTDKRIDSQWIQKDLSDGVGLFVTSHDTSPYPYKSAWQFQTAGELPETQMLNDTTQLIILGHRQYMWDLEPASMQMSAVVKSNAQTGFPGTPWPSVYNAAKWQFNMTKDQETGRWLVLHGYDHGSWVAQPDMYLHKNDTWSIYWWSGVQTPEISDSNIPIAIEALLVPE